MSRTASRRPADSVRSYSAIASIAAPNAASPRRRRRRADAQAESLEVLDDGVHAGDVLVGVGAGFELVRRHVGDEVLAKRRQPIDRLGAAPRKPHVRREHLVARAHQVVAVERLHVDRSVRRVVDRVEEDLGADRVREPARHRRRRRGAGRVRGDRCTRRAASARSAAARDPRRAAGPSSPNRCHHTMRAPARSQRQPGRDVRLVIQIADDDLGARCRASGPPPG